MVSKELSTEHVPYTLKNVVSMSCAECGPVRAMATTTVRGASGASLTVTEHGSGVYSSEEDISFSVGDKSISLEKDTNVKYKPTSFHFSDSFSVNFSSRWPYDI